MIVVNETLMNFAGSSCSTYYFWTTCLVLYDDTVMPRTCIHPLTLRYDIDFRLTRDEFIALLAIWNVKGCYAVFHEDSTIPFKITSLAETARYKALDNFKWTIELAVPDSASDGWSKITSPNASLIDRIESLLK